MFTGSVAPPRAGRRNRDRLCAPDERGSLRDIERTTRQRIPVAQLPVDFMAAAEAFKRLKPAPKAVADRSERSFTKADRRYEGQRRQNRNGGQRPELQRDEGKAAVIVRRPDRPQFGPAAPSAPQRRPSGACTEGGQNRNVAQPAVPQGSEGRPADRRGGQGKPSSAVGGVSVASRANALSSKLSKLLER